MTIIAVDNHKQRLMNLVTTLWMLFPDDKVLFFTDPLMALKHIFTNDIGIVFTEADMRPIDGQKFSEIVREQRKDTVVYCITDKTEPNDDESGFSACLTRPVTVNAIKGILQSA